MNDTRWHCWQVQRDASNSEAVQNLDLLEPLQTQRQQAQELIDDNKHQEAIDVLAHVIEVPLLNLSLPPTLHNLTHQSKSPTLVVKSYTST